jgi:beta-glucosidase
MKNIIFRIYILLILNKVMKTRNIPELPKKLKIGYASWGECDEKIYESVQNGLNVIIWFSIDMSSNSDKAKPEFTRGPNYVDVAKMIKRFKDNNFSVINLISIGGWNSPHVNTQYTAEEYLQEWFEFNKRISNEEYNFYGFDGIDWDIEGNSDINSSINYFTYKELDIMGQFSQLLKKEGYIVSMAPAESYLDPTTDEFSLSLLYNYPEWEKEVPDFKYHGRNAYSYLLAKYHVDTFDFISIQLYEGYSHTLYKYQKEKKPFGIILYNLIKSLNEGYIVDFSKDKNSGLNKEMIKIPKDKIVIGLANGWAGDRFLFVDEKNIIEGWNYLKEKNSDVKGIMFWDIADEGKIPNNDYTCDKKPFFMAKILNNLL